MQFDNIWIQHMALPSQCHTETNLGYKSTPQKPEQETLKISGLLVSHEKIESMPPPPLPKQMASRGAQPCTATVHKILLKSFLAALLVFSSQIYSPQAASSFLQEQCDLSSGMWIPYAGDPCYTNSTCRFISSFQDCMTNGRPDTGYLHWRWKPHGCELPPLNATEFLNMLRSKTLAFIGDSVFRNQIESLLCILSTVEEPIMIYHDETFQTKTWLFLGHNATLRLIWAPFLVESTQRKSKQNMQLYVDVPDATWAGDFGQFDYVLFSGGQWFFKETVIWEGGKVVGCHNCPGKNLDELGYDYAYRKALRTVLSFMAASEHKPLVMLRTWSPSHFEYGEWFNGGICNRTQPFEEGEFVAKEIDETMRGLEVEAASGAAMEQDGAEGSIRLRLLDTFHLSALRPDAHPGPYRWLHRDSKRPQDCLHWCLPGAIDTWNDMLVQMLMSEESADQQLSPAL